MCVSVQKKRLFGLSPQNRYAKEQRRTKKASHRDLYICVSVYRSKENTASIGAGAGALFIERTMVRSGGGPIFYPTGQPSGS